MFVDILDLQDRFCSNKISLTIDTKVQVDLNFISMKFNEKDPFCKTSLNERTPFFDTSRTL